jgi:hypothetical protein
MDQPAQRLRSPDRAAKAVGETATVGLVLTEQSDVRGEAAHQVTLGVLVVCTPETDLDAPGRRLSGTPCRALLSGISGSVARGESTTAPAPVDFARCRSRRRSALAQVDPALLLAALLEESEAKVLPAFDSAAFDGLPMCDHLPPGLRFEGPRRVCHRGRDPKAHTATPRMIELNRWVAAFIVAGLRPSTRR